MANEDAFLSLLQRLKNFAKYIEEKVTFEEKIEIPWKLIYKIVNAYSPNHEAILLEILDESNIISGYVAIVAAMVDNEKCIPKIFEKYVTEEKLPDLKNIYKQALVEFMNHTVEYLNGYLTRKEIYDESILFDIIDVLLDIRTIDAILLLKNLALHPIDSVAITAIYALAEIESSASKKVLLELYRKYKIENEEVKNTLKEALIKSLGYDEYIDLLNASASTSEKGLEEEIKILERLSHQIQNSLNRMYYDSWKGEYADILNHIEKRVIAYNTAENILTTLAEVMAKIALISKEELELMEDIRYSVSERFLNLVSFFKFESNIIMKEPLTSFVYQKQITVQETFDFSKILEKIKSTFNGYEITFREKDIIWIHPKDYPIENGIIIYYFPENKICEMYIFGDSWKEKELEFTIETLNRILESK
ncbi:MAG: hypothetical protein ACP6IS_00990 [Candidatus Asgardarchaeia archaeon]